MARGDVHNDMYTLLGAGGRLTIQPGSGDEWVITHIGANGEAVSANIDGYDGTNTMDQMRLAGLTNGDQYFSDWGLRPTWIGITNSQYCQIHNDDSGLVRCTYSAMETK